MSQDRGGFGGSDNVPSTEVRPQYVTTGFSGTSAYTLPAGRIGTDDEVSLTDLVKLVRSHWKIIALSIAIFAVGALVYGFTATSVYTAIARIEIAGYTPILPNSDIEASYQHYSRREQYLKTQIQKIKSLSIADRALGENELSTALLEYYRSRSGIKSAITGFIKGFISEHVSPLFPGDDAAPEESDFSRHYGFTEEFLQGYLSLIEVRPIEETAIVEIAVTTADPKLSQRIANTHSEAYINHLREERNENTLTNLKFLREQREELKERLSKAEQELAQYAENNELVSVSKDQNLVVKQIADLTQLLAQATAKRAASESLLSSINGAGAPSTAVDDESIQRLRTSLKEAEAEYADLNQKLTPAHPSMIQLAAKISSLKEMIKEQRQQAVSSLKSQVEGDREAERKLLEQIDKLKAQAHEVSKKHVQYNILEREYDSSKDLYQTVLRQLKEAQISSANSSTDISINDYAAVPAKPSGPMRGLIFCIALFCGALVGLTAAVTLHLMDNTLKNADDVQNELGLPSLGFVPCFSIEDAVARQTAEEELAGVIGYTAPANDEGKGAVQAIDGDATRLNGSPRHLALAREQKLPHCIASDPLTVVAEAFRTIRASILLSTADNPPRVLMVTSSKQGEGKTTFSSNLAVSLAQASHRVLVIDSDLRRSRLHERFGVAANGVGLVDYLAGQASLAEVISETPIEHLDVLSAGSNTPNPAELLGSEKMAQLIELLGLRYDYIVVDTPPILPVSDALVLSRVVDGVILVIRSGDTEKPLAQEATKRLRTVNAPLLGVVINDLDVRQTYGTYEKTYGYGYIASADQRKRAFG